MPKRRSDAGSRIFFDELVSIAASRLRATGAIRLEDRHGIIAFGDKQKLIGVAHTVFKNGGSWSYFVCPRCGRRAKSFGSSTMRHAAGCAWKSSACATARPMASAEVSACESEMATLTECRTDDCAGADVASQARCAAA